MQATKILIIYAISSSFALESSHARPSSLDINVRERCRRIVAGQYLASVDHYERAKQSLQQIEKKLAGIEAALKNAEKDLKKTSDKEKHTKFDINRAAKLNSLIQAVDAYKYQLKNYKELQITATKDLKKYKVENSELKAEIKEVFTIEKLKQKEPVGYPFRVVYKHSCSKYRILCPLPYQMAIALKKIQIQGETPESCVRYASYSNL